MAPADYPALEGLLATVKNLGINELVIRRGDVNVSLVNQAAVPTAGTAPAAAAPAATAPSPAPVPPPSIPPAPAEGETLKAPLTGTFYRSNGLNAPNLAEEGTDIKAGAPICIIEAMKLFNQIKVEKPLHLVRFLVKTGETVQKGAPYAVVKY
jgi:acetyl-CoA carboxylase biotin carboxyl carrier protein